MEKLGTVQIRKSTREALKALKRGQQSYDDLLMEILAFCEKERFEHYRKI